MKHTISVTNEHIGYGERCGIDSCALALAFEDAFDLLPGELLVDTIGVAIQGHRYAYLPEHVAKWADDFDAGRPVQPITFSMEIDDVPEEEEEEE